MNTETFALNGLALSPIYQVLILCLGTLISFLISYYNQYVSVYLPFISETGAHGSAMNIFSLTLYFGSVAGSLVVCCRYFTLKYNLINADNRLKVVNKIAFYVGLISMGGLAGVGAFPMLTILWAHLLAAGIHFVGAMVYIILQTIINYYEPGSSPKWNKIRVMLGGLLIIFLIFLVIFFPLSHFKWIHTHKQPPAMKTPNDQYFGILFASCLFEWLLYGTFLTYMFTFYFEFKTFEMSIGVASRSQKGENIPDVS